MREPFELEVGEIVEFDSESYICVKDDPYNACWCFVCAFFHTDHCLNVKCIGCHRKDRNGVHFVKREGGGE